MRMVSFILATITLATCMARAGTLQEADVPAGAKWVAHFDNESYHASAVGKLLDQKKDARKDRPGLTFLKETLGIDPVTDILGITLYGEKYGDANGVAVLQATLSEDKLLALLNLNDTHKTETYGAVVVHAWTNKQKNKPAAGAFYNANTVVLAQTPALVKRAIDTLDGKVPSLKDDRTKLDVPEQVPGVFMFAVAAQCEGKLHPQSHAHVVKSANSMAFAVAGSGNDVQIELQIGAASVEKATYIENMIRGITAFMMLNGEQDPALADITKAITVTTTDKIVAVNLTYAADKVMAYLEAQQKNKQALRQHCRARKR